MVRGGAEMDGGNEMEGGGKEHEWRREEIRRQRG